MTAARSLIWLVVFVFATTAGFGAPPQTQPVVRTLPASRGGQDLIGKPMPAMTFDRWLNSEGNRPPDLHYSVVLYGDYLLLERAIQDLLK